MKEIILSQSVKRKNYALNLKTLVDDEDYEYLSKYNWCADRHRNTYYVHRVELINGKKVKFKMHRVIMNLHGSNLIVDHIDGNGLNNCKSNLRICTSSQNSMNRSPIKNTSSKYKGVYLHRESNKWAAGISAKGKKPKYLGLHKTEEEAALAYNSAAIEMHGEFAKLNVVYGVS